MSGTIMVIAGTDSSGGAGLTRDTAVAASLGLSVCPIVTAVTAQTHDGVRGITPVPAPFVAAQMETAFASGTIAAVKIGMLGSAEVAQTVALHLADHAIPVVIDPVLRASSGGRLMSGGLPGALCARAALITPNLPEAAALTNSPEARTLGQIATQARVILTRGCGAVLIKGGHATGTEAVDHLFTLQDHRSFAAPMLARGRRGTGCTLATAIACHLAQGAELMPACGAAKAYTHDWLAGA